MDMYDVFKLSDRTENGIRKASFRTSDMVCSSQIDIELEGDIIRRVQYTDGCHGNTQGIAALCAGQHVADVVGRIEGIDCRGRGTSCPDQLSRALIALSVDS